MHIQRESPPKYISLCESLSSYRYLYPLDHPLYDLNPAIYSHHRFYINRQPVSILSKVVPAGRDYSGRENKFAHHIILDQDETVRCGPAWVMMNGALFRDNWNEEPCLLPMNTIELPRVSASEEKFSAPNWQSLYGDGKPAGILAQSAIDRPGAPSFIIFDPQKIYSCLPLIVDAMMLIPPEKRWEITFNTCFFSKPMDSDCLWRCCINDPKFFPSFQKYYDAVLIDLSDKTVNGNIPENRELKKCAQTGAIALMENQGDKIKKGGLTGFIH